MTPSENALDDENAHVQELKRLFLSCNVDENKSLNAAGLHSLFTKLKLAEYAKEISERVLCGALTVDFEDFKERFVSYLPEIIDVSSGTVDTLLARSQQTAQRMGFRDIHRLTRYETRLLCENTKDLEQLSVVDINSLFERADVEKNGRVSMQQFLAQYRLQKRLSAEVHFIADSYVSSLNLFESLDPGRTGSVDCHDLMEMWNKSGLRIDEGLNLLKESGQPMSGPINAVYLSGFLERELSHSTAEAPVAVKAAIVSLHCCIDHLRCSVREGESRAEHLHKQLQLANQRRHLLIEELENNQLTIEQGYDKRIRETEERYRAKLIQMEDKFRVDKREIQTELEQVEEELSRIRQQEVSMKNKVLLFERQTTRLNEETREQQDTISQLEQLNRQLRNELSKVMQPRPVEDNTQLLMWKQKVDLLVAHNKRLREKIQDLTASQKKKNRALSDGDALSSRWSTAFRTQLTMIRKRRAARGDTLSEMDSEPESIFVRHRRRKLQKRKDRKKRHDAVSKRLGGAETDDSSSNGTARRDEAFAQRMEEQLYRLKEDHKKEVSVVRQTASRTMADALNEQEKQLSARFDRERKQYDIRLVNEKNNMERQFAEEKMKLMSRLQEDFDTELKRIASMVNRPESAATVEQYKRQIKALENSLEGQKNGYEKRITDMRDKYRNTVKAQNSSYMIDKNTTNFFSLIEKYRNADMQPSTLEPYTSSRSSLSVEKRPLTSHNFPQRSLSSLAGRCEKCELTEGRLREIYHTLIGDQSVVESGIEDVGSSAGSQTDDKIAVKRELRKIKGRLDASKEKVTELRVLLSMQGSKSSRSEPWMQIADKEWRRNPGRWSDMASTVERLESEKLLLEARLSESQALVKNLVEQYKSQLDETARLGNILKDVHSTSTH